MEWRSQEGKRWHPQEKAHKGGTVALIEEEPGHKGTVTAFLALSASTHQAGCHPEKLHR